MFFTIEKCTKFQPKTVPLNVKKIKQYLAPLLFQYIFVYLIAILNQLRKDH